MHRPVGRALRAGPILVALASQVGRAQAPSAAPTASPPVAARLGPRDLGRLRWIVGDWRGVGTAGTTQAPFYERYRLADDSTLVMEGFPDSTFGTASETTRYELRTGRLADAGGRWTAVRLDSLGVEFAAVSGARNGFRWERAPGAGARPRAWQATILSGDRSGTVRQRHYRLERLERAR
jgi:hypothetical protein